MPKFAIYYIPDKESEFYELGSSILGYDIRTQKMVEMPSHIRKRLEIFDYAWVSNTQPYGFHLTIGDSIEFNMGDIHLIETEFDSILRCFDRTTKFELHRDDINPIPDWGPVIVLRYNANENLKLLHTLVISRINTLGIGSGYLINLSRNPNQYAREPHKAHRILKFYSPFVLDDFKPHFSIFNPYSGSERAQIVEKLNELFSEFTRFSLNSICLVIQETDGEKWAVYREYKI